MQTPELMRVYGRVFLATGLVFLLAAAPLNALLGLPNGGHGLWLGLAGSLMAVLSYVSYLIGSDPFIDAYWNLLLLSKGVSSLLFVVFAVVDRNPYYLVGLVDAAILVHLVFLRAGVYVPYRSRAASRGGPFHEGWFVMAQDPASGLGFWARYGLSRLSGSERAECRAVLFDKAAGRPLVARWEHPAEFVESGPTTAYRLGDCSLTDGRAIGSADAASWDLTWSGEPGGAFRLVPPCLAGTGLLPAGYEAIAGLVHVTGEARVGGRTVSFERAAAGVGHLWGSRGVRGWRWARAVFERPDGPPTVFEILTAVAPLAVGIEMPMTSAYLIHDGNRYPSVGLFSALRASSVFDGKTWSFRVYCAGLSVEGECRLDESCAAEFPYDYDGPRGAQGVCRTSMTGALKLRTISGGSVVDLATEDRAIVEFAEPSR